MSLRLGINDKPESIFPEGITIINEGDFDFSELTVIDIPDSVTVIGDGAFAGCTGLTSITVPDSVTEIGWGAFAGCMGLTSITIPDSVTEIGPEAFSGCIGLKSITIPDSVTEIGVFAFQGCTSLTRIVVAESNKVYDSRDNCNAIIETDGNRLIAGCQNTVIPDSVIEIAERTFEGCTGLMSFTIPDSVMKIGTGAFNGCTGLTNIVVAKGNKVYDSRNNCNAIVESDGNRLIAGCQSTVIPDSVTGIGYDAFYGCKGLKSITIPDSVTEIGMFAFLDCTGLTSITIPDSVTEIGSCAFNGCTGLTSINIPTGVKKIGTRAFDGCSIETVTLGSGIDKIEYFVFDKNPIKTIYVPDKNTDYYKKRLAKELHDKIVELPA